MVHSRQGSVITKDPSVLLPAPAPALLAETPKKSSSRRLTGLGITFGSNSTMDLSVSQMSGVSREGSSMDVYVFPSVIVADAVERGMKRMLVSFSSSGRGFKKFPVTPPPAYVRDIQSDKV
jgi:hypothetical protein